MKLIYASPLCPFSHCQINLYYLFNPNTSKFGTNLISSLHSQNRRSWRAQSMS